MALPAKVLSELLLRFKPQGNEGELRPQRARETSVIRMPADEVEKALPSGTGRMTRLPEQNGERIEMAVIVKKAEKVAAVVSSLPVGFSFEAFLEAFQAAYPKEWANVVREYQKHERKTKPGKAHPMPEPVQYMRNALNVHLRG
ncbi:hypothetical protein EV672_1215 [Aquabacterium commune]|uniref:Uncharacterized protein n=1 Tax=Aquabacterium commune TaxID=70586 RepID=A0A4R6QZB1_9BURK|nr:MULTISPECIES: hypothetical protein [Aquabacterium]TDP78653.1 hypothetical protein EV672_1215 [Aquabacterium commune]